MGYNNKYSANGTDEKKSLRAYHRYVIRMPISLPCVTHLILWIVYDDDDNGHNGSEHGPKGH